MKKWKRWIFLLSLFIVTLFNLFPREDPLLVLTEPYISEGHVVNNSYYYGEISITATYTGEKPLAGQDKEAYYSIDGGVTWEPVPPGGLNDKPRVYEWLTVNREPFYDIRYFHNGNILLVSSFMENNRYTVCYQIVDNTGADITEKMTLFTSDAAFESFRFEPPHITILRNDNFAVHWRYFNPIENNYYIYGQIYTHEEDVFDVYTAGERNEFTSTQHGQFIFDVLSVDNCYAVAWCDTAGTSSVMKLMLYDFEGIEITTEPVSLYTTSNTNQLYGVKLTQLPDTAILATWKVNNALYGAVYKKTIYGFDPVCSARSIHQGALNEYNILQMNDDGFVVCYTQMQNTMPQLYLRKFDAAMNPASDGVQIPADPGYILPVMTREYPFLLPVGDSGFMAGSMNLDVETGSYRLYTHDYDTTIVCTGTGIFESTADPVYTLLFKELSNGTVLLSRPLEKVTESLFTVNAKIFDGEKRLVVEHLSPAKDIGIQFKVVDPVSGESWYSPVTHYKQADATEGHDGSIGYADGYCSTESVDLDITVPEGNYAELLLLQRKAPLVNGETGQFSEWYPAGELDPVSQVYTFPIEDGYSFQFQCRITNYADIRYEYVNDNMVMCDRSAPDIRITNQYIADNALHLEVDITDEASGVLKKSYQLNINPEVAVDDANLIIPLVNGSNHIRLSVFDRALNNTVKHLFKTLEIITPELHITGVNSSMEYDDKLVFRYTSNVPLMQIQFFIDAAGVYPLEDSNGNITIGIAGLEDGVHTLSVKAETGTGEWLEQSVDFRKKYDAFSVILLSPSDKEYGTNTIPLDYRSNRPLSRVWYTLDDGEALDDPVLAGLPDGKYTIELFAEDERGVITSTETAFSVSEKFPTLSVLTPSRGMVYPGKTIEVSFISNAEVSYTLGETTTGILPGETIELPGDGEYTILFTAVHPVSGNVIRKSVPFTIDTIEPGLEILSPGPHMYAYTDIPVEYRFNKEMKTIRMFLDNEETRELANLSHGSHEFRIEAEDVTGRKITKRVYFQVVLLEILSPEGGDRIVSYDTPPVVLFEYDAGNSFQYVTRSIDGMNEHLVTEPPRTRIPLTVDAGDRELAVSGYRNNDHFTRWVNFQIGRKNITADEGSIDYRYEELAFDDLYDVTVFLSLRNTGHLDLDERIPVRFDHITPDGNMHTRVREISGMKINEKAGITITGITAHFGDTFLLTVDPDGRLTGEYTGDNFHKLVFQTGQITGVNSLLADENVYIEKVSLLNVIHVQTAGPFARVEYHTPDKIFIDDTPENGFFSIVDMGLLTTENSSVKILAYGENGIILDSKNYDFHVKKLPPDLGKTEFPWANFVSLTDNSFKRIYMNELDTEELLVSHSRVIRKAFLMPPGIIPVLDEKRNLTYKIVSISADESLNDLTTGVDMGNVPVIGGLYNLPNGKGYIQVSTIDTLRKTASADGVIPVLDGGTQYTSILNGMWQDLIEGIDETLNEQITIEHALDTSLTDYFSKKENEMDKFRFGDWFFIRKNFCGIASVFALGFLRYSINDTVHVTAKDLSIHACFDECEYFVYDTPSEPGNPLNIEGKVDFSLTCHSRIGISTHSSDVQGHVLIGANFLHYIFFPIVYTRFNFELHPQNFIIPFNLSLRSRIILSNGEIGVYPVHTHLDLSIRHDERLFDADISVYFPFTWPFGIGKEYRGHLDITATGKADMIYSMAPGFYINPLIFNDAYGKLDLDVIQRDKICLNILGWEVCHKTGWYRARELSQHSVEQTGIPYTSREVDDAIEQGFLDDDDSFHGFDVCPCMLE
ncbi:MAG: hypothetical protein JXB88_12715 [Spirochaetales bacterium]|nr:hypothetical protein [Spirochaetales bacterium]